MANYGFKALADGWMIGSAVRLRSDSDPVDRRELRLFWPDDLKMNGSLVRAYASSAIADGRSYSDFTVWVEASLNGCASS